MLKPVLAITGALRDDVIHLFVCLSLKMRTQNAIFPKTKQFGAMVSTDDFTG